MSHFVCGYKTNTADMQALNKIMLDVVPAGKRKDNMRLEGTYSSLFSYGVDKVIPDVLIKRGNQDSWLAVVGTPLVQFKDKETEHMFLDEFLASPIEFLLHRINGNFALFCYDSERKKFIVATDFENNIPVFFAIRSNGICFSSHELVLAKFLNAEIDQQGFAQQIHLGNTWGTYTRFKGVSKMLPCRILVVDADNRIHLEPYWTPGNERLFSCDFDELIENFLSSLKESVQGFYEAAGCKPIMADLTGGEDTRLLVAQCHSLGIPFKAHVTGTNDNSDVIVAKRAAEKVGIDLIVRKQEWITKEDILAHAQSIVLNSDAYREFTQSCAEFAIDTANPLDEYKIVKLCGVAGEDLRGTRYIRGKAIFPARTTRLDYRFFTKFNFLLDYHPNLMRYSDEDFIESIHGMVRESLKEVEEFPLGTQIDHLVRVFDTCFLGLRYKEPLYLPFMTKDLVRSMYFISPYYKQGGKLTRACTEILFPALALVKTEKGVPTIRMTKRRFPFFLPEYIKSMKSIKNGITTRLLKWKEPRPLLSMEKNAYIFKTILTEQPYRDWFSSPESMMTGQFFDPRVLGSILVEAKVGAYKNMPILGRIISLELACRWVYR
jgi:hypothetical protein